MKKIFIGYDESEAPALHALIQSLLQNSKEPLSITPILKKQLPEYSRPKTKHESSDFSLTRFLVPYLSNYEGWSLYCDCDFIFTQDITKIFDFADEKFSLMVCKHDYVPLQKVKKDACLQEDYQFKNWSSLMLFNCGECKSLTPKYINEASGLDLHQFVWLPSLESIGCLPKNWNYLVGEQNQLEPPVGIHYTNGICLTNRVEPRFAQLWLEYYQDCKLNLPKHKAITGNYHDEFPAVIRIQEKDYVRIPPLFKNTIDAETDYIQVVESTSNRVYHLKKIGTPFRDFTQKIEYIKCQHLGSLIATQLGLITQKSELVKFNETLFLLTDDIRGIDRIYKMDPLAYLSENRIEKQEKSMDILLDELNLYVERNESTFFTKMLLFDHLIANSFRDAQSIRIVFDNGQRNKEGKIELCCDVLIENNFGSGVLISNTRNRCQSVMELFIFLKERGTLLCALEFINDIDRPKVLETIQDQDFYTQEEKQFFSTLLENQYEELKSLKELIEENYLN